MSTTETRHSHQARTTPPPPAPAAPAAVAEPARAVLAAAATTALAGTALATFMSAGPAGAATTGTGITPGFPTSTNTGVPAGTPMKTVPGQVSSGPGWAWNTAGGYLEVSGNGADLSGLKVNGNIDVSANNVTINHVKINAGGDGSMGISLRHTTGITIENSNINGLNTGANRLMVGIKDIYGDATATTVENNNITKTSTDVQIYAGTIENNYMAQHGMTTGDHINGVTTNGDDQPLLIQHNTILNNYIQTDAIGLFQDFSDVSNVTINNNFLAGGGYTIYGGTGSHGPTSHIVVTSNTISTMYYPHGGYYGPATAFNPAGTGNVWSGNTYTNGKAIPAP